MSSNWWRGQRGATRTAVLSKTSRQARIVPTKNGAVYVCYNCGKKFPIGNAPQKYCSPECRHQTTMKRRYNDGYLAAQRARTCEQCGAKESIALLVKPVMLGRMTLLCEECECEARGVEYQADIGKQRRAAARAARKPQTRRAQPAEADALESTYRPRWGGRSGRSGKKRRRSA